MQPILDRLAQGSLLADGAMGTTLHTAGVPMDACFDALNLTDPARVIESIGAGAAASWSLNNLAPRALRDDFAPGFYVKHFLKDMRIALGSAEAMQLELPGLALARKLYDEVAKRGWEENGTQILLKWYQTQG